MLMESKILWNKLNIKLSFISRESQLNKFDNELYFYLFSKLVMIKNIYYNKLFSTKKLKYFINICIIIIIYIYLCIIKAR